MLGVDLKKGEEMGDLVEQIARVTHEANRAYCLSLGDTSQPPWDGAPDWQKDSARQGVAAVLNGTANTPEEQHQEWMGYKLASGWKYGPVKDADKKEHPCMVPYSDLPEDQKRKDHLFRAVVTALSEKI